jgi:hypothetical protein
LIPAYVFLNAAPTIHPENLKELEFRRTGSKARSSNIPMFVSWWWWWGGGEEATDDTARSSVLSPVLKKGFVKF